MRTLVTFLAFIVVLGVGPMAMAQSAAPLVAEGLSLPRDHQYERYDSGKGTYTKIDVGQVPALVKQKQPVYDRTAKAWVYNSPKGLDPRYAAAAAPAPAPAATAPKASAPAAAAPAAKAPAATAPTATAPAASAPAATAPTATAPAATAPAASAPAATSPAATAPAATAAGSAATAAKTAVATAPATAPAAAPLVADGLSLPRDRQYERYNASTSSYGKVEAAQVPALVKQKVPIYDRTAKAWVLSPDGKLDPRYTTAGSAAAAAPITTPAVPSVTAAVPSVTPSARGLKLPRDHQYERFNSGASTYTKVEVAKVPGLIDQEVPIYDRTAKAWVYSTDGKLDPRYGTLGSANPTAANLALPRDHQYERYDTMTSTYAKVDIGQVPKLVEQQVPVYDRTAKMWVIDTDKQINPRYAK
jgi:hypothetical protein